MRKVATLTGKNLPRLAVAKPGWPEPFHPSEDDVLATLWFEQQRINQEHADRQADNGEQTMHGKEIAQQQEADAKSEHEALKAWGGQVRRNILRKVYTDINAVADFTRVCDQTGLSEKLRKD